MTNTIFGMKVVVNPYLAPVAKWELRKDVPCTDAFRREYNEWLKDFFGATPGIVRLGDTWFVAPEGLEALRKIQRENPLL